MTEQKYSNQQSALLTCHQNQNQTIKYAKIVNNYVEEIKNHFKSPSTSSISLNSLITLFNGANTQFLVNLAEKMNPEDYQQFLNSLVLVEESEGNFLIEKGKKVQSLFILIQGQIQYNVKSEIQQMTVRLGNGYPGFVVYPEFFMTPRYVNLSVFCESDCSFLAVSEEMYNKYLKKMMIRQIDNQVSCLSNVSIFNGISQSIMRKYFSYFFPKMYKFNEVIISPSSPSTDIYIIKQGQVQLSTKKQTSKIKLVNLSAWECFGFSEVNRSIDAKSLGEGLQILIISKYAFDLLKNENAFVGENCIKHEKQTKKFHSYLLNKTMKVLNHKDSIHFKVPKKKKKKANNNQASLSWWGLAQNFRTEHKYRIMNPHFQKQNKSIQFDHQSSSRSFMTHKINQLWKRAQHCQTQIYSDQVEEQKENMGQKQSFIPKMKVRIRAIQVRPKAIDMAENIKKKLMSYARNKSTFCEKLAFE